MDNDWNSLAVLGLREGQGASLTAVNLAIGLAMDRRVSVLLVDLNLRSPAIHEFFDYMPSVGFQDYFLDLVDFPQLLFNPGIQRLVVLASEDRVEHSSEFLLSTKMSMLIEEIRNRYPNRIVIFDFPPLLDADDAIACRRYFDAALLVLKDGVTQRKDLSLASELLGDKSVLGTVLTGVGA